MVRLCWRPVHGSSAPELVLVNGRAVRPASATLSVWDTTVQRGDGIFEVLRVVRVAPDATGTLQRGHGGNSGTNSSSIDDHAAPVDVLALDQHLDRMFRSADALMLPVPATRQQLAAWIWRVAVGGGPGALRLLVTRGAPADGPYADAAPPSVVILWQPLPRAPPALRLEPMVAPWHPAGHPDWPTIKWLSYGPNMLCTRRAQQHGYDDAVLLTRQHNVLDGPTFSVGWFHRGTFYSPCDQALGMLQSCTLTLALQAARDILRIPVQRGVYALDAMLAADEVCAVSSMKDVLPVSAIGSHAFPADGQHVRALQKAFRQLTRQA